MAGGRRNSDKRIPGLQENGLSRPFPEAIFSGIVTMMGIFCIAYLLKALHLPSVAIETLHIVFIPLITLVSVVLFVGLDEFSYGLFTYAVAIGIIATAITHEQLAAIFNGESRNEFLAYLVFCGPALMLQLAPTKYLTRRTAATVLILGALLFLNEVSKLRLAELLLP